MNYKCEAQQQFNSALHILKKSLCCKWNANLSACQNCLSLWIMTVRSDMAFWKLLTRHDWIIIGVISAHDILIHFVRVAADARPGHVRHGRDGMGAGSWMGELTRRPRGVSCRVSRVGVVNRAPQFRHRYFRKAATRVQYTEKAATIVALRQLLL